MGQVSLSPSATAALAAAAAARARHWLLYGPAQLRCGEQAGGIAGQVGAGGEPSYIYAEITGYFLHWLADIATEQTPAARQAALGIGAWVRRQLAGARLPPTRIHLDPQAAPDWRNDALFFFDLAMLLRGLSSAQALDLVHLSEGELAHLIGALASFVGPDGELAAVRRREPGPPLPQRWSTQGGAFLVKASAAVHLAGRRLQLPLALQRAHAALLAGFADGIAELPLRLLHPTLYFAEGMLVAMPARATAIASLLDRCLRLVDAAGELPESEDEGGALGRNDLLAQALRLGLLLRGDQVPGAPSAETLQILAGVLSERVGEGGGLAFCRRDAAAGANVWCTLFAEQALRWYARSAAGQPLPPASALV